MAKYYSVMCAYHNFLIQLFVDGHWVLIPYLSYCELSCSKYQRYRYSFNMLTSFALDEFPGVEWLGHMIDIFFKFLRNYHNGHASLQSSLYLCTLSPNPSIFASVFALSASMFWIIAIPSGVRPSHCWPVMNIFSFVENSYFIL